MSTIEPMLGSPEVAQILGVKVETLNTWRHRVEGPPYYTIGRSIKYRRSEVEEWLQRRKVAPANSDVTATDGGAA